MSPVSYSGEASKLDDELDGSEVDEIDTSNLISFNKKMRNASSTVAGPSFTVSIDESQKQQLSPMQTINVSGQISPGESLLNSVKSPEPLDVDQMLNVYNDPGQSVDVSSMNDGTTGTVRVQLSEIIKFLNKNIFFF